MENKKFTQRPEGVIVWLILFFPVGIYFMWKNDIWSKKAKVIISIVFGILFIGMVGNNNNKNGTTTSAVDSNYEGSFKATVQGVEYELAIDGTMVAWTVYVPGLGQSAYLGQASFTDSELRVEMTGAIQNQTTGRIPPISGHFTKETGKWSITIAPDKQGTAMVILKRK